MVRRGGTARRWVATAAALCLVLASCSSGGDETSSEDTVPGGTAAPPATEPAATDWPDPAFEPDDCPMPVSDTIDVDVECGWVEVPEDRLDPDSRMIRLAVARLSSRSPDPRPDPVVQLEGGPGFSSLEDVERWAGSVSLDERDLILWDQRGLGFSEPNLDCPETNDAIWGIFATADDAVDEGLRIEASLTECRERLLADGVALDGYDTTQNAADLEDIRLALGIEEWNLRGVSYGSALAIETMRNHPEGLHSVLLDSVVPPDSPFGAVARGEGALRAFDVLWQACADDAACSSTYGDLEALVQRAAARLDAEPYVGEVPDPLDGGTLKPVTITGNDLWAGLFNALYDRTIIPALPGAAASIAEGDYGIIAALAADGIPFAAGQHEGMTASVDCADRMRLLDPDAVDPFLEEHPELGALVRLSQPESGCERWGVEPQPAEFNELLTADDTDVPVLVMAGAFDPITPPEGSQRVADALGVEMLLFPNVGHGAVGNECGRSIWIAFMDDPTGPPDATCLDEQEPLTFG